MNNYDLFNLIRDVKWMLWNLQINPHPNDEEYYMKYVKRRNVQS